MVPKQSTVPGPARLAQGTFGRARRHQGRWAGQRVRGGTRGRGPCVLPSGARTLRRALGATENSGVSVALGDGPVSGLLLEKLAEFCFCLCVFGGI